MSLKFKESLIEFIIIIIISLCIKGDFKTCMHISKIYKVPENFNIKIKQYFHNSLNNTGFYLHGGNPIRMCARQMCQIC